MSCWPGSVYVGNVKLDAGVVSFWASRGGKVVEVSPTDVGAAGAETVYVGRRGLAAPTLDDFAGGGAVDGFARMTGTADDLKGRKGRNGELPTDDTELMVLCALATSTPRSAEDLGVDALTREVLKGAVALWAMTPEGQRHLPPGPLPPAPGEMADRVKAAFLPGTDVSEALAQLELEWVQNPTGWSGETTTGAVAELFTAMGQHAPLLTFDGEPLGDGAPQVVTAAILQTAATLQLLPPGVEATAVREGLVQAVIALDSVPELLTNPSVDPPVALLGDPRLVAALARTATGDPDLDRRALAVRAAKVVSRETGQSVADVLGVDPVGDAELFDVLYERDRRQLLDLVVASDDPAALAAAVRRGLPDDDTLGHVLTNPYLPVDVLASALDDPPRGRFGLPGSAGLQGRSDLGEDVVRRIVQLHQDSGGGVSIGRAEDLAVQPAAPLDDPEFVEALYRMSGRVPGRAGERSTTKVATAVARRADVADEVRQQAEDILVELTYYGDPLASAAVVRDPDRRDEFLREWASGNDVFNGSLDDLRVVAEHVDVVLPALDDEQPGRASTTRVCTAIATGDASLLEGRTTRLNFGHLARLAELTTSLPPEPRRAVFERMAADSERSEVWVHAPAESLHAMPLGAAIEGCLEQVVDPDPRHRGPAWDALFTASVHRFATASEEEFASVPDMGEAPLDRAGLATLATAVPQAAPADLELLAPRSPLAAALAGVRLGWSPARIVRMAMAPS